MSDTEALAISVVQALVSRCPNLQPALASRDKYPSYDGDILVMIDGTKSGLEIIKTQIKGRWVASEEELDRASVTYQVSVDDLENYHANGGALFFVVLLYEDKSRIYYRSLLPAITGPLLDTMKGQKSKNIELKPAPHKPFEFEEMVLNHSRHSRMQASFASSPIVQLEDIRARPDVEIVSMHVGFVAEGELPIGHIVGKETFLYAKIPGCPIPVPTSGSVILEEARRVIDTTISVEGDLYFTEVEEVVDKSGLSHNIGAKLTIHFPREGKADDEVEVIYTPEGSFDDVKSTLEMLDRLTQGAFLGIDGVEYQLDFASMRPMLEEKGMLVTLEAFRHYERIREVLGDKSDVHITKVSPQDIGSIDCLYRGVVLKEPVRVAGQDGSSFLMDVVVFNRKYLMLAEPDSNGCFILHDWVSSQIAAYLTYGITGEKQHVSKYAIRPDEDWLSVAGVSPELLVASCTEAGYSELNCESSNGLGLYLLAKYDETENLPTLEAAIELFEWLSAAENEKGGSLVYELNLYQAKRRKQSLNDDELVRLREIYDLDMENKDAEQTIGVAALVLLGDEAAIKRFEALSDSSKKSIADYPMGVLLDDLRVQVRVE